MDEDDIITDVVPVEDLATLQAKATWRLEQRDLELTPKDVYQTARTRRLRALGKVTK